MSRSPRVQAFPALLAGASLLGLAACAGVPSDGEVQTLSAQQETTLVGETEIRVDFTGPREDADPVEVVRGFLAANAATEEELDRAGRYLRPTAANLWRPESVLVVSGDDLEVSEQATGTGRRTVRWQAPRVAEVDPAGRYRATGGLAQHEFQLEATSDGWRIVNPPAALVLTAEEFERVYRDVRVYYLARGRSVLVPDQRFVAAGRDEVPARIVEALFAGPSPWLAPAVLHFEEVQVERTSVVGGVAEVRLASEAGLLSESRRSVLAAQIATSLSDLNISGVRILAGDQLLEVDAPEVATRSDWRQFQADAGTAELHLLTGGLLTDSSGARVTSAEEPRMAEVALSGSATRVAGVVREADGDRLVVVEGEQILELLRGSRLTSPEWGGDDELYVIRDGTELVRLRLPDAPEPDIPAPETVALEGVPPPLRRVAVAPDGVRAALVAGPPEISRLYLGLIDGLPGAAVLRGVHRPVAELLTVESAAWSDETELLLGARTLASPYALPVTVGVDGSSLEVDSRIGLREGVSGVAAHPDGPSAVFSGGRAYVQSDDVWIAVGVGGEGESRPVYPG